MESACVIHVVDDNAAWRKSVERLMTAAGYQVAVYKSAKEFLDAVILDGPGCILLDVRMPGLSGLQLQERLAEERRGLPIVFLSGHGDIPTSVQAIKSGAEDFLTKPVETEVLLATVARVIAKDRDRRIKHRALDVLRARIDSLTPTERKVFAMVVRGTLNKRIAAELGTAERTIKWHRHNIMEKLQLESLAEMVSLAERLGMIGTPESGTPDAV